MNLRNNLLISLPHELIQMICGFLKVKEINQLSQTCKQLYQNCFIVGVSEEFNHLISAKSNANVLYCSSPVKSTRILNNKVFNLKLIRFNFLTKDQGWVRDCQSGSWIQAQFTQTDNSCVPNQPNQNSRTGLVYNYQVPDFADKQKIISSCMLPKEKNFMNIYLRSQGNGWQIACKRIRIVYVYRQSGDLKQKQLARERVVLKKKKRRAGTR